MALLLPLPHPYLIKPSPPKGSLFQVNVTDGCSPQQCTFFPIKLLALWRLAAVGQQMQKTKTVASGKQELLYIPKGPGRILLQISGFLSHLTPCQ